MGLIKVLKDGVKSAAKDVGGSLLGAGASAASNAFYAGLWKEYLTSGDMSAGVIMKRAEKVSTTTNRNNRSDDNIITSGSGIDVQPGQCMIIVENGAIVEICDQPGRYTYDNTIAPSLLFGGDRKLSDSAKDMLNEIGRQFAAGGQRFSTQRVYFINMGQIWDDILWGLGNVQFTHSFQPNPNINPIRMNVKLKAHGRIKTRIENPLNFFNEIGAQKAGGDNNGLITVSMLNDSLFKNLKTAINSAVTSSIVQLGRENVVSYGEIMAFSDTVSQYVTEKMQTHSLVKAGFGFYDFYIDGSPELSDEDYNKIMQMEEKYNMVSDPMLASYDVQKTFAKGFENAGQNGGVSGIMGMGMAMGGGGFGQFGQFQQAPQQPVQAQPYHQPQPQVTPQQPAPQQAPAAPVAAPIIDMGDEDSWICECGHTNTGKFCMECGSKKPIPQPKNDGTWTCGCGTQNTGKFCMECGSKRPEPKKMLICDKCGWTAPAGVEKVKFCPECGDIVTEADYQ